jgi:hypothetical protein
MNRASQGLLGVCAVALVVIAGLSALQMIQSSRGSSGQVGSAFARDACARWGALSNDLRLISSWDSQGRPKSAATLSSDVNLERDVGGAITKVQDGMPEVRTSLAKALGENTYWEPWVDAANQFIPAAVALPRDFVDDGGLAQARVEQSIQAKSQIVEESIQAKSQIDGLCSALGS